MKNWVKLKNSNTAPEAKAYNLIPQGNCWWSLLDKLCWVWWKPKMCKLFNLTVPLLLWFAGFNRWNHSLQQFQMASSIELLTPFNFHSWKGDMEIQLCSRGLYQVTMDTKEEPTSMIDKTILLNKKDEAFILLCLFVSRDLLFHFSRLETPKEIWDK